MRKFAFTGTTINMLLGLLAVLILVGVNELGYISSHSATQRLEQAHNTHVRVDRLLRSVLNLESGLRGYLLTGDSRYIESYARVATDVGDDVSALHLLVQQSPEDANDFTELAHLVARKLSELDLSLQLRHRNNDDAWKFVLSTDIGLESMEAIRTIGRRMIDRAKERAQTNNQEILHSLML